MEVKFKEPNWIQSADKESYNNTSLVNCKFEGFSLNRESIISQIKIIQAGTVITLPH